MELTIDPETELVLRIHRRKPEQWQVIRRSISATNSDGETVLTTVGSRREAQAWAEGRQSVTGQPIRMSE